MDNVRWFVMGDDDTVFFIDNLITVLAKYDHNQMYYIGGSSESVEQNIIHSYTMAYGGGGFAVSYPLAAELVRILDGCIDRYADFYGSDQKIQGCISEIGVQVTKELGFHQVYFVAAYNMIFCYFDNKAKSLFKRKGYTSAILMFQKPNPDDELEISVNYNLIQSNN